MDELLIQTDPAIGLSPWLRFSMPTRILSASTLQEVRPLLREVEKARANGHWAAGFLTYEAARAFDSAFATHEPSPLPLAWFGLFDAPIPGKEPARLANWEEFELAPAITENLYIQRIAAIKSAISRGETYQVNFTFQLRGVAPSDPLASFARLHQAQRGGYSALVRTRSFTLCSASPELFFLQKGKQLTCRPMKGTAPRGCCWDQDEQLGAELRISEKNRAENVMIVDMIRNDLGRLAPAGEVRTKSLFDVQRLPTLWQMTSTVEARCDGNIENIFAALFPCASITGAPKVRTMQIIRELEDEPRGIYTGAIGFAGPDRVAQFNVAIRTLALDHTTGQASYGIGSGIVWDSDPQREYEECLSKALILQRSPAPFQLLATMLWRRDGGYYLLERHLARLQRAAIYFGFNLREAQIRQALRNEADTFAEPAQRVRLLIATDGSVSIESSRVPPSPQHPWQLAIAREPLDTRDPFLYFKTTRRAVYENARSDNPNTDDTLLWNERGEATETTIANFAVKRGEQWITPPVRCGLLDGILREELLEKGRLIEGIITLDEIRSARKIALLNSVRGWWPAVIA